MRPTDQPKWEGDLDTGYREMAQDEEREIEALSWAEATIGDVSDVLHKNSLTSNR
jgi:hypothetical protein